MIMEPDKVDAVQWVTSVELLVLGSPKEAEVAKQVLSEQVGAVDANNVRFITQRARHDVWKEPVARNIETTQQVRTVIARRGPFA